MPRTNYIPVLKKDEYIKKIPKVCWIEEIKEDRKKVTEYYRLSHRKMLSQEGERTFISAIVPKNVGNIINAITTAFKDTNLLLVVSSLVQSLPFDFIIKVLVKMHI